ncbi:MAG: energy-coupling factor transporter transmembrane protein EcfT [Treponema succinifaciens]|nr:MAG: energy-coupling factor transporter transmembrane protein EcfT [Treponema succinifaciens]
MLKLCGATLPLALMLSVTKLADLSNALVEKLHVPYKYAFTLTTAIRFIPVFAQEMEGIQEAQTSRGIQLDTKNPLKKLALILPLCAPLLVSSVRKTSGTAIAADLRGFKLRTSGCCLKKYPYKARDFACFAVSFALIAVSILGEFLK